MEEEKRKIVVENENTRNRYVVLQDSKVDLDSILTSGVYTECVIYQDYKHFVEETREYVEVPEDLRGTHVMPKNEFRTKFALVLDL